VKRPDANECVTECGVPGVGTIPRSFHFCNFYRGRKDLVDSLVPYFAAGLKSRERCIWVCAEPLGAREAMKELAKVVDDLDARIESGQIQIRDAETSYKELGLADAPKHWLIEEEKALAAGFQGLRISGNTSFVTRQTWDEFMAYEKALGKAFEGRRITTFCCYPLDQCGATGVFEAARRHQAALERRDVDPWVLMSLS
jgi:hypothetical protein